MGDLVRRHADRELAAIRYRHMMDNAEMESAAHQAAARLGSGLRLATAARAGLTELHYDIKANSRDDAELEAMLSVAIEEPVALGVRAIITGYMNR
jgi:hypothetical protein